MTEIATETKRFVCSELVEKSAMSVLLRKND